jgi:hypothetical protein
VARLSPYAVTPSLTQALDIADRMGPEFVIQAVNPQPYCCWFVVVRKDES